MSVFISVGGLPKVPKEKCDKLKTVLKKVIIRELTNKAVINIDESGEDKVEPFTIDLPLVPNENGEEMTVGFCYLTFRDTFEATNAVKYLSHVGLDNRHCFRVCRIDDFENVISEAGEYAPAEKLGFRRVRFIIRFSIV